MKIKLFFGVPPPVHKYSTASKSLLVQQIYGFQRIELKCFGCIKPGSTRSTAAVHLELE